MATQKKKTTSASKAARVVAAAGDRAVLEFGSRRTHQDAAVDAARLRFRPILMTAISSIAGFMPLMVAAGAGAASRQAIGTAVVGGMIAATFMSLLFTPVFYVVMARLGVRFRRAPGTGTKAATEQIAESP